MTTSVCLFFQVHQPFRLKSNFSFFDIGSVYEYEDSLLNRSVMEKVAANCYLPANQMMQDLIKLYPNRFKLSFSISGTALDQMEMFAPNVLSSFQDLAKTGNVEFLAEPYYHSLAFLHSRPEFEAQVEMHCERIKHLFGKRPKTFCNTELIYNNDVALAAEKMGFSAVIAEGVESVLRWRSPNFVYMPSGANRISLLLKNTRLSDDIAFRFSQKFWPEYPLTPEKFALWVTNSGGASDTINLFMDYETFGEHQPKDSGIFEFFNETVALLLENPYYMFQTPNEVIGSYRVKESMDIANYTSWADESRDLSAWRGNSLQDSSFEFLYELEKKLHAISDPSMIHFWRKLQSSDHFYYMCTKRNNDGHIHKYFSPFKSPHDAFIAYTNILNDFKMKLTCGRDASQE